MRYATPSLLALSFLIFPPPHILAQTDLKLSPELEVLRPFLGDWVGEFQNSGERPPVLRSWKPALDGQAVREIRTVPDFDFEAESLFFFDREAGGVGHVGITNNGYLTRGGIRLEGEEYVQTGEQIMPDGTLGRIRVSFRFQEDGTLLNQLFNLVEGEWEPSHVILYRPAADLFPDGTVGHAPEPWTKFGPVSWPISGADCNGQNSVVEPGEVVDGVHVRTSFQGPVPG